MLRFLASHRVPSLAAMLACGVCVTPVADAKTTAAKPVAKAAGGLPALPSGPYSKGMPKSFKTASASIGIAMKVSAEKTCAAQVNLRFQSAGRVLATAKVGLGRSVNITAVWAGGSVESGQVLSLVVAATANQNCRLVTVSRAALAVPAVFKPTVTPVSVQTVPSTVTTSSTPDPAVKPGPVNPTPDLLPSSVLPTPSAGTPNVDSPSGVSEVPVTGTPPSTPPDEVQTPTPAPVSATRWFAADSVWNRPLASDAPVDPLSDAYVAALTRDALHNTWAPWIDGYKFSTRVYEVGANQQRVAVTLDQKYPERLRQQWASVPVPPDALPAPGGDGHLAIYQPSTDTMWEFWRARLLADGWHAMYGGRIENFSQSPGYYTGADRLHGATATSLPLMGGLMRISELQDKRIDHALSLAIPSPSTKFVWPAQRGDGKSTAADAIPSGTRFRV
ncbi:MAG: hypothetical protein Q7T55_23720, partial [Solirubrobacteraceae bacterium]|nr:hypothetical protein [Solirubrobacteraceae bacterium]